MTVRGAAVILALALALAACGGGDGQPETVAAWKTEHGDLVRDVEAAIDRVQASTREGEPTAIRANCEGLRDTNAEARATPRVPNAEAESALRQALDAVATAAENCARAMARGDTRLLEKSIGELREARLKLDTANARLNA